MGILDLVGLVHGPRASTVGEDENPLGQQSGSASGADAQPMVRPPLLPLPSAAVAVAMVRVRPPPSSPPPPRAVGGGDSAGYLREPIFSRPRLVKGWKAQCPTTRSKRRIANRTRQSFGSSA